MTLPSPLFTFFFFNDTATTEIYTLSLHDALPIFQPSTGDAPQQLHCLRGLHSKHGGMVRDISQLSSGFSMFFKLGPVFFSISSIVYNQILRLIRSVDRKIVNYSRARIAKERIKALTDCQGGTIAG